MKHRRRQFLRLVAGAAALPALSPIASAQSYPERPIKLVVPFPPGGAYDLVGRPWSEQVKPLLGTIVVKNIGGGGSSLGAAAVARAQPDGYTILLGGTLPHVNEALIKARPLYDPARDLNRGGRSGHRTSLPSRPPASRRRCASATSSKESRSATRGRTAPLANRAKRCSRSSRNHSGCRARMTLIE